MIRISQAELRVGEPHDDERDQEVRHAESEEAQEGEEVVPGRVLLDGRVDADREGDNPDEQQRRQRQQHRQHQPLPDQVGDRLAPLQRLAEVAVQQDAAHPLEVLHVDRLIQPVLLLQRLDRRLVDQLALALQRGDVRGQEVAGRQLDDDERDDRDDEDRRDEQQDAPDDEGQH
jgi:hypothetical protein